VIEMSWSAAETSRSTCLGVPLAQFALIAAAVVVSRLELSHAARSGGVLLLATLNAGLVTLFFMRLRLEARFITVLVVFTLLFIAGLLFWPAWDVYERVGIS
jgi:caa(3)-type oxidase subunit IV